MRRTLAPLAVLLLLAAPLGACQDEPSGERLSVPGLQPTPRYDAATPEPDAGPDAAPEPDVPPLDPATDLVVATYNVQNLFDVVDDPGVDEGEFTPAPGGWTAGRMASRLSALARAFQTVNADIVAVNEVENRGVLLQLRDAIRDAGGPDYPYVGYANSRDPRGIDVALLSRYPVVDEGFGRPINLEHRCDGPEGPQTLDGSWPEARPILQAEIDLDGDGAGDLVALVNHWKAKGGSYPCFDEAHRLRSALQLRQVFDQLIDEDPARPVIALGDFNAHEFEPPLREALDARLSLDQIDGPNDLFNAWGDDAEVTPDRMTNSNAWNDVTNSSYNFRGNWTRLDHILLSGNLRPDGGAAPWRFVPGSVSSVHAEFLLDRDGQPRSWSFEDEDGFSDHLPVRVRLSKRD